MAAPGNHEIHAAQTLGTGVLVQEPNTAAAAAQHLTDPPKDCIVCLCQQQACDTVANMAKNH